MSFSRGSLQKSVVSGVVLEAANSLIDASAPYSLTDKAVQGAVQAGSSYFAPPVSDTIFPALGLKGQVDYQIQDAASTGLLYSLASGMAGRDGRSWLMKFLFSAGSDFAAAKLNPSLPKLL